MEGLVPCPALDRVGAMAVVHRFNSPERFVAGTVGEPGDRTFFLQARDHLKLVSVSLEKQQVAVLAERIEELITQVSDDGLAPMPELTPDALADTAGLDTPIEDEFRVGTMTLAWDNTDHQVVLELIPVEADDEDPDEMVVVQMSPEQALGFARRAASVVDAGRPACPFCGNSIDPDGHLCVRANGYRQRNG